MAADNHDARAFHGERERHRGNARRAIEAAKQHLDALLATWDERPSSLLAYNARQLAANAAEAGAEIGAFLALHDVRFIVDESRGEVTR